MKHLLIYVFLTLQTSLIFPAQTYSELGKDSILNALTQLSGELGTFNTLTLPHETKVMRKHIGKTRAYLDMFALAYPIPVEGDLWKESRLILDNLYEHMGSFKDLFDMLEIPATEITAEHYDLTLVSLRRDIVLTDLHAYFTKLGNTESEYFNYFQHPLETVDVARFFSKLPKYYWRHVDYRPFLDEDGGFVFKHLMFLLLDRSCDEYKEFLKIKNPIAFSEKFHEFRKTLRSTLKLPAYMPKILNQEMLLTTEYKILEEFVEKIGKINDLITTYEFYSEKLPKKSSSKEDILQLVLKKQKDIQALWSNLLIWENENNVGNMFLFLQDFLKHSS